MYYILFPFDKDELNNNIKLFRCSFNKWEALSLVISIAWRKLEAFKKKDGKKNFKNLLLKAVG